MTRKEAERLTHQADPMPSQTHYRTDCAYELADTILARVEVDEPDILLSEN